jgi:hypothetical protein
MQALGNVLGGGTDWDPKKVGPEDLCYGISETYNARASEVKKEQQFYPTVQHFIDTLNPDEDSRQIEPAKTASEKVFQPAMQRVLDAKGKSAPNSSNMQKRLQLICKGGLEHVAHQGGHINFFTEGMDPAKALTKYRDQTTSKELRHLYRRWNKLGPSTTFFDAQNKAMPAPWENPATKAPWDEYAKQRALKPAKQGPSPWDGMYEE